MAPRFNLIDDRTMKKTSRNGNRNYQIESQKEEALKINKISVSCGKISSIHIIRISGEEWGQKFFENIMFKGVSSFIKKYQFIDPKSSTQPSKISTKKTTRGHNIIKLVKTVTKSSKKPEKKTHFIQGNYINSAVF